MANAVLAGPHTIVFHEYMGVAGGHEDDILPPSRLINRNIIVQKGRTSMRLEPELWDALREICRRQGLSTGEVVKAAEQAVGDLTGRTSALRIYVLDYFRQAATEQGHARAGHGKLPV